MQDLMVLWYKYDIMIACNTNIICNNLICVDVHFILIVF